MPFLSRHHLAESKTESDRPRVLIVQPVVPHYRVKLYELLYQRLQQVGIELQVAYGTPNAQQSAKRDLVDLPESIGLKVKNYWFFGDKVLYQPIFGRALSADLVIVLNANGHVLNYLIAIAGLLGRRNLAFWVWWPSLRANPGSFKERIRRQLTRAGNWWFAYTSGTRNHLLLDGIPGEQITVLNNSVDVAGFRAMLTAITEAELHNFAKRLGISIGAPIGLFCGGLYDEKHLEFLFEAVKLIQADRPDFHLLVLGDGVRRDLVSRAAASDHRIHYLGPCFAKEKALCFRLAKAFLCPGLVGLAILDAFTAGLPLITTDIPIHSPEIEYLDDGVNGLLIANDSRAYANAIISLLKTKSELRRLSNGALASSRQYSIESMANRYAEGIIASLKRS
ncbi:glycosyltransferase family 4 protein [Methylomonas montana]|uniref:glycosyltransferase family 4 protein n=1 Tax=Methylomonas montana TaxID=3058963 RepID=UPI00265A4322|nr:glycosyltransferase family 4 protein [Methylomonas montana]WKJ91184.1 glycosyltransferase family 4 protein [Methylomonas montana]